MDAEDSETDTEVPKKEAEYRCWIITRWPHKDDGKASLKTIWQRWQTAFAKAPWLCGQIEHGEDGKWHIQAALHLSRKCSLGDLVRRLGGNGVHVEPQGGTNEEAKRYVTKPDYGDEREKYEKGQPVELKQGQRTDLAEAAQTCAKEGVVAAAEKHTATMVRYGRGVERVAQILKQDPDYNNSWRDVTVVILWGGTGAGKSEQAKLIAGERGLKWYEPGTGSRHNDGTMKPYFNEYDGEGCIIFNEFTGWLDYKEVLKITDGHPYRAEERNGRWLQARWTLVVFTSSRHPSTWFNVVWDGDYNRQFRRRITHIIQCLEGEEKAPSREPIEVAMTPVRKEAMKLP